MPTSPAPAQCARVSPCCKGWPPAGDAGVASPCTTKAPTPRPGYHCANRTLVNGRGERRLSVGGAQIDKAVTATFLAALEPAGVHAAIAAAEAIEADHDAALAQWHRQVERARYEAARAERRYLAVDPDNRLVARGLEADWEAKLAALADAEAELARRQAARPRTLTDDERRCLAALGADVARVWSAPTTTDRDRKELLRTLLDEVVVDVHREDRRAELALRWRGGAVTELAVELRGAHQPTNRTDEDTIALLRRLAVHYPDATIAGIINRQGRRSATGQRFTATIVQALRHHWHIPRHQPPAEHPAANSSPSPRRPRSSASSPPPCTAGSTTGSSPASSSPPAPRGASASPTNCAPASSTTPRPAGWRCSRPPTPSACPAKPCCSVSSAASSKPSTSAPDAEKACGSR